MRIQKFPIDDENPARLELRWESIHPLVYFDGNHVATLEGASGMRQGWSTELEDGSRLEIRTVRRGGLPELSVLRMGST